MVARRVHYPEVAGSSPVPATHKEPRVFRDVSVVLGITVNDGEIGVAVFGVFSDADRAQEVRVQVIRDLVAEDPDVEPEGAAEAVFVLESVMELEVVEGSDG